MYYEDIDFAELSEYEKESYTELKEFIDILEKKNVLEIIHEYCWDVDYIVNNGKFGGITMLIDPTYKIYLDVAGGEGYICTEDEKYLLELPDNLNNSLYDTFEIFYKYGVKKGNIISA